MPSSDMGRRVSLLGQPGAYLFVCLSVYQCRTEPGSKAPRSETIQEAVQDILSGMEVRRLVLIQPVVGTALQASSARAGA